MKVFLVILGAVSVVMLAEVCERSLESDTSKAVGAQTVASLQSQGVWVIVGVMTPVWQRLSFRVTGSTDTPLWLAAICFLFSIGYILVANCIASKLCRIGGTVDQEHDPLKQVCCDRTRYMINQACFYTTGSL